ncbi:LysR family transcriptional regulator [Klebsiella pneumoniae]|uniref:LysR family transcriptional regulator n=1 Tax=Klebsiella pneumoniae TaxID=573 RepID=A0A4P0Y3U5_KLEPN|nr:LysR family transcriptional regulator [Klebsiella pneumoniae]
MDVVGEGIDVAIRVRPRPIEDSDLVMRVLADRGHRLVASPDSFPGSDVRRRRPS